MRRAALTCECGECRTCRNRQANREWRARDPEHVRAISRAYYRRNSEKVKARVQERGYDPEERKRTQKRWREHNREKVNAEAAAQRALRSGKIERQPCEVCGAHAEMHHDDYSKPLVVRWLCRDHHKAHHSKGDK